MLQVRRTMRSAALAGILAAGMFGSAAHPAVAAAQRSFAAPKAAVEAMLAALRDNDEAALLQIFGDKNRDIIAPTDKVAARVDRRRLYEAAQEMWNLQPDGDDKRVVLIGPKAWPMAIPLVRDATGWRFDTDAGREELLNRLIGRNELEAVANCRAYVAAQQDYASVDRDGDMVLEYAQRLGSTSGSHNGLYWKAAAGEEESPFGPLVAEAAPYLEGRHKGDPYRGYYYRILTRQGAHPPGGAYDYIINGNMIGGFALIAYPADYGISGVMTFVVNQQGVVFQKDLGPQTTAIAGVIETYDPDDTWTPVADE